MGTGVLRRMHWAGSMVHLIRTSGLIDTHKRFISVIASCILASLMLAGCQIVQPSRQKLAEMNSFYDNSYQLIISVDLIDGNDFAMQYNTAVTTTGEQAAWNGSAMVYSMNGYFVQDCISYTDGQTGCKEWRNVWVESDTISPAVQLASWQSEIIEGRGYYDKKPADISSFHEDLSNLDSKVWSISFKGASVDWNALCDVDLDKLFGGNEKIGQFEETDVTFLYDTKSSRLRAILATTQRDNAWINVCIQLVTIDDDLNINMEDYETTTGYPSEEWDIYYEEEPS